MGEFFLFTTLSRYFPSLCLALAGLAGLSAAQTPSGEVPLTPAVQGVEVPRRILVLYGHDPKVSEKLRMYAIDTLTASTLQSHLEWLGYELDYFDAGMANPPTVGDDVAGVVVDGTLQIPAERELLLADWLNAQRLRRKPILILGDVPFRQEVPTKRWQRDFGVGGDLEPVRHLKTVEISKSNPEMFSKEIPLSARQQDFFRLIAPENAEIYLSLKGKDEIGGTYRYDPVFRAPWGVAWLAPYVTFNASGTQRFFYLDPTRLVEAWMGVRVFPAPDATTRLGRRIFFSHIDGDGFGMKSARNGQPICGEIIRDQILRRYPFPVTVSIIESDIRGQSWSLKPEDAQRYEAVAKSIFELPNVEPASHSYSHPFYWDDKDFNPGDYASRFAPLHPSANYPTLDLRREIEGSVKFINDRLLPPGKKVELMLWSGNCRPGVEALRITRELGLENMNGGDTTVSEMYPSLINVAPRVMQWGDELQIYAANQNEFMYADGFSGPFFGGFSKVVDTFERTESPHRLKPVNVYYHFYSALTISAERALRKILDWCWAQQLHHITATEYSRIVNAAHSAKLREVGQGEWLLMADSHLRTWRLPASAGLPDIASSDGILGYEPFGDVIYIHTDGRPQCRLRVVPSQGSPTLAHLYVAHSSGDITVAQLSQNSAVLSNAGLLPVRVAVGGAMPSAPCSVVITGHGKSETQSLPAGNNGQISFILMDGKEARITTTRSVAVK